MITTMSSVCISSCVNDTISVPHRVRATYVNLHRWPESEAEFVRAICSSSAGKPRPKVVVDSMISCRQVYLRSYTFTREPEKSPHEQTNTCFGSLKEKVTVGGRRRKKKKKKMVCETMIKRVKEVPCAALRAFFRRLLFCTASVDVVA
ncbi:hypothetical protein Dimus_007262 [Dionaea muscipula]